MTEHNRPLHICRAMALSRVNTEPQRPVYLIDCGVLFLMGFPDHPLATAVAAQVPPLRVVVTDDPGWTEVLEDVWIDGRVPVVRWSFQNIAPDTPAKKVQAECFPGGAQIRSLEIQDVERLSKELGMEVLQNFENEEKLLNYGGVIVERNGLLLSACCAFAAIGAEVEVAVSTCPGHRRQGHAYAAAQAYLADCNERGLHPSWDASSMASRQLAMRLGFIAPVEYIAQYRAVSPTEIDKIF